LYSDPALHAALVNLGSDQAFDIAYHTWWPNGADPWYLANQNENTTRINYYGVTGTPTIKCDGSTCGTNQSAITSAINSRRNVPSDIWLDLYATLNGDDVEVTCTAVANQDITGNVVLQIAMMEQYVNITSPNGQNHHYHPMVDMDANGYGQAFSVSANDTNHFYATLPMNAAWAIENLDVACFVQNNDTREVMQAKLTSIPIDFPNIVIADYEVTDPTGNGDGRIDPDETGEMVVTLENMIPFHNATDIEAELTTDDPLINVTVAQASYPDLVAGFSAANNANPFEFYVDPDFVAHEVTFNLTVYAEPGSFQATYPVVFMVGRPEVLLLNDDLMDYYQAWYEGSLNELEVIYDSWNQSVQGQLPQSEMDSYDIVIWYTGDDAITPISPDEQTKMENYLNNGGRLLLSSQNAGDVLAGSDFYQNVLHAQHVEDTVSDFMLFGVDDDPVSDGTSIVLVGAGGAGNGNSNSSMEPISPAVGIYIYSPSGGFGAIRCQTEVTRFIYFGIPVEAITGNISSTMRSEILETCLDWIAGPVAVEPIDPSAPLPDRIELSDIYPNPFNPSTEISFALPASMVVQLSVFDLHGRVVAELIDGVVQSGWNKVQWNADSHTSGMYIVMLTTDNQRISRKAVLLK